MRCHSWSFLALALIVASGCGGTSGTSNAIDGSRSSLVFDRAAGVVADGKDAAHATVTVVDTAGKPVAGIAVALSLTGTGGAVAPSSASTDVQGRASFQVSSTVAEPKVVSAQVSAGASAFSLTGDVSFVAGPPDAAHSSLSVPARAHVDEVVPISVSLADAHGNPCPAVAVALQVSGSGNQLTPASGSTDATGTFAAQLISSQVETKTVSAHLGGFDLQKTVDCAAPAWTLVGPDGGEVALFRYDPSNPTTVYAAASEGGLFRSTDAGATWTPLRTPFTDFDFKSVVVDPTRPSRLYVGTGSGGMYRTTDGGLSWVRMLPDHYEASAVVMDPSNPEILYAATEDGVFKTTDGGDTWTRSSGLLNGAWFNGLVIDPANPSHLFVAVVGSGVYASTDGGASWSAANTGLSMTSPDGLVIAPTSPATLYVFERGKGIAVSSDGAASWTPLTPPSSYPVQLAVDPNDPAVVFEAAYEGLFESSNGGTNWTQIAVSGLTEVDAVAVSPASSARILAGGPKGPILLSADSGATWNGTSGFHGTDVVGLVIDASASPEEVLAAGHRGGIFGSLDDGATWSPFGTSQPSDALRSLAADPSKPKTFYVGTVSLGVYSASGSNPSWSRLGTGTLSSSDWLLAGSGVVYSASDQDQVYALTSSGSWQETDTGLPATTLNGMAIDPTDSNQVYTATADGIFHTSNGGTSWTEISPSAGRYYSAVAVSSLDPATLYVGRLLGSIWKSTDRGASWTQVKTSEPSTRPEWPSVTAIAVDPTDASVIYAAVAGRGIVKSIDGGATWNDRSSGLWLPRVHTIAIDPLNPATVYLATGSGVFKTTVAGE